MAECNWPFWACIDGTSRLVLTRHQRENYNPKWQSPVVEWGGVSHKSSMNSNSGNVPPETTAQVMSAKPNYPNSNWRRG